MNAARIVVLLLALGAGGIAAMLTMRTEDPVVVAPAPVAKLDTVDVLVAGRDVSIGTSLTGGDVSWQSWPQAAANNGQYILRTGNPNAQNQIAGAITRASFSAGEPIRESKLIRGNGSGYMAAIVQPGMRAIATDISPETGAGGFILPNDRVDVILTRSERTPSNQDVFSSEIILSDVRVLAIDQTVEEKNGQKVAVGKIATLELTPRRSETLALARRLGTLSLALRGLADNGTRGVDPAEGDRIGAQDKVSIVRFGLSTPITPK